MNWPTFFLFVYAAFLLWLGWREFGRDQDHVSFAVAGRRSSGLTVGMSIVASSIGGSATIGMVALSYEVGFPAIWWLWSGTLGLVVLSTFLARRVRESGVLTMPDLIEHYMGKRARVIAALIIVVAWSAILAAQFSASARIVTAISPLGFGPALVLGAGVVTAYAVIGGQASVLKSDVYQYLIVIVALLAVLGWLAGTTPQVFAGLEFTLINERFGAGDIAYYMLVLGGSYVVCPMLFSRLLSARDEAAAQRAVELTDSGGQTVFLARLDFGERLQDRSPGDCGEALVTCYRRLGNRLDQRIPDAAPRTLPLPLRRHGTAFSAGIDRLCLGHAQTSTIGTRRASAQNIS